MTLVTKDRDTLATALYETVKEHVPRERWKLRADDLLASGAVQTLPDALRALAGDEDWDLWITFKARVEASENYGDAFRAMADYIETKEK